MEEQLQNEGSPLFGLNVDHFIKSHLSETAKWAKFLSIIGLIVCAFLVLGGIFAATILNTFQRTSGFREGFPVDSAAPVLVTVIYLIIAVLYFFPCLYLLRFANKMRTALASDNQESLTASFQNLKSLFRFVGILTIILLSFWVLVVVFGGLAGLLGR
jgi:hypothetical protein